MWFAFSAQICKIHSSSHVFLLVSHPVFSRVYFLKVTQLTLWPGELKHWAVTSLCLWRLHAASVSLPQRNWYRLTLLSLTEPHYGLTLRSVTAVGLRTLSSSHRNHTGVCRHTYSSSDTHNTQLASGEITAKEILELVRQTLIEMSCLVSSMENRVALMLISWQQLSIPEGIHGHLTDFKPVGNKEEKRCMALFLWRNWTTLWEEGRRVGMIFS